MSAADVRAVADAVLYEGYLLYPYRSSAAKNRSRWQFGVLMPHEYAALDPGESAHCRVECVLEPRAATTVEAAVRFLQLQVRTADGSPPWEEAVEQEVVVRADVEELTGPGVRVMAEIPGGEEIEADGPDCVVRVRRPLRAEVAVSATRLDGPWAALRLRIGITNRTALPAPASRREEAIAAAMVAVHTIIVAEGGRFVSMVDPPEWARALVEGCRNIGGWPVLAGSPQQPDTMLAAPIILYDHPQIAPESPGDLFDATEIDEILTLRTMTLTDTEKREARATDPRAAALLDRVDGLDPAVLEQLHGAMRFARPVPPPESVDWLAAPEGDDTVMVGGVRIGVGSTVRLRPGGRRADAQDMFLVDRLATVEAVLLDVDDRRYLAVTLVDDPGAELRRAHGRFLYFGPDELAAT